jgi:hypothetical protein
LLTSLSCPPLHIKSLYFYPCRIAKKQNILSEEDYDFLASKESGIRGIRNIMTHRNAYQYCLEGTDGKALHFAEPGTWTIVFESYAPRIIQILYEIINNSHWKIDE